LKTGTPINISKSFFGIPPGFNVGFGFCSNAGDQGKNEKSSLTSYYNIFSGQLKRQALRV